ncbi:uncharacterized protein LOC113289600 [Papaver somniferum]|uniref:uncharacterized protein LOC113289600 n=1 Tax=Papaver somniferum TaxID=3469 RepID=UPI000E6F67A7|nr:uncharacterized protein LOC113289600 [Papaver somniferum]
MQYKQVLILQNRLETGEVFMTSLLPSKEGFPTRCFGWKELAARVMETMELFVKAITGRTIEQDELARVRDGQDANIISYISTIDRRIAPRAGIADYKFSYTSGCFSSNITSNVNQQAIKEWVIATSISIGGGIYSYYHGTFSIIVGEGRWYELFIQMCIEVVGNKSWSILSFTSVFTTGYLSHWALCMFSGVAYNKDKFEKIPIPVVTQHMGIFRAHDTFSPYKKIVTGKIIELGNSLIAGSIDQSLLYVRSKCIDQKLEEILEK